MNNDPWNWVKFNGYYDDEQNHVGHIELKGFHILSVIKDSGAVFDAVDDDPTKLIEEVVKVLNRELPGGRPRDRRAKLKTRVTYDGGK